MFWLSADGLRHITANSAVDGRVRDITDGQEVGSQTSHTQFGHVSERLTYAATKQKTPQLLVQARNVTVSNESPRVNASKTYPVAFTKCNLGKEAQNRQESHTSELHKY